MPPRFSSTRYAFNREKQVQERTMTRRLVWAVTVLAAVAVWLTFTGQAQAPLARGAQVPIFEYDPTFPKPLPENWAIGAIGGMAVDRQDHVYVVQRPGTLRSNERFTGAADTPPKADCCIPAPPVLEFDQAGTLVHSWGGPGAGYDWPQIEHGIFVDQHDTVWLAGSGDKDAQLLKFTREGTFLQQFGKPGMSGGSADTKNMGKPANLTVDPVSNEVYVADGYGNRRVIVLDAGTFAFKRMWGAYGNKPDDAPLGPYNPDAPPAQQFRLPHNISISRDGFVYVADRPNNRIQVFRKDGTFVKEAFVSKRTLLQGAASGFALSPDPQQRFLYMIDGANHHVWILDRQSLTVIARFGQQGLFGGSLNVPHAIAVDGRGNIYVGENFDARRFQRFLFKGLGTPRAGIIPPTTVIQ
jgi:DNA-binding beta-propeller fold protein YncE